MPPMNSRVMRNPNANFGTQIDQLGGIQVGTSIVLVNLDTDRRFHNIRLQVTAINYTGGTAKAITKITSSAGAGATGTLTINAYGVPTAIAITAGGTGWTVGDTFTIADATGAGFVGTVATVTGGPPGAIATATVTVAGTPTAAPVGSVLGIAQLLVNGSPVGDLSAAQELNRALINPLSPQFQPISLGQFPIFFTEPWRWGTRWQKATSWDMAGQQTFSIKIAINPGYQQVNVVGTYEYDFIRNTVFGEIDSATYQSALAQGNAPQPLLQLIARHAFTPTLNAGQNILTGNQIPILPWPILRMHCSGSTAAQLTQSILLQDGQTVESGFIGAGSSGAQLDQLKECLIECGFNTAIFDYSYIADKTQKIQDCLKFAASMKWSVYSAIAQGLTIVQERLQTRYE